MVNQGTFPPILSLVFGALCAYYGFSLGGSAPGGPALLLVLFLPLPFLCLFRVLSRLPPGMAAGFSRRHALAEQHLAALAVGLAFGFGAGAAASRHISLGLPEEQITGFSGILREDPRMVSGGRGLGSLALESAEGPGGLKVSARGELPVFFPDEALTRIREFGRGSRIYVEGSMVSGKPGPLAFGGQNLLFRAMSVHVITPAPALEQFRTGLRLGIVRRFSGAAPGSAGNENGWGGLALALLLGIRDNLEGGLSNLYQKAGSSHILALSGMHLAIISALIAFCLKKPLGLRAAAAAGAVFILFYVFLVGVQPSLNRAALMYFLGTLAVLGALPKRPGILLGLSFLIQIVLWPSSGLSVSFILSYAALAGILTAGEALHEIFLGKAPEGLLQPLAASLGAFLATAGITVIFFGSLRPIGILAGLVLVPLTSLFMLASLVWLILGFIAPPLAVLLGRGLSLLYGLMDQLVTLAAQAPGIPVSRPLPVLALSLGLLVFITGFGKYYGIRRRRVSSFA
jgi:competence protein ComEC